MQRQFTPLIEPLFVLRMRLWPVRLSLLYFMLSVSVSSAIGRDLQLILFNDFYLTPLPPRKVI